MGVPQFMRTSGYLFFYGAFFGVYVLVNSYIFRRGWQAIPRGSSFRGIYAGVFSILALSYVVGRLLQGYSPSLLSEALIWVGSFWFAGMLYFFLFALLLDLLRTLNRFVPIFPPPITQDYPRAKRTAAWIVIALVGIILVAGHINARTPRLHTLRVSIPKRVEGIKSLRIVVASDVHLGTIIGRERLQRIVGMINALDPDLVLLPGDILDENPALIIQDNVGGLLESIRSKYGVLAVTGNHEYIGGVDRACRYLSDHGILVLRDEVVMIRDTLYVVGREDRSITRFKDKIRKPLEELMANVDRGFPVILMDHQPFDLEEAVKNGIDLQLSGHTHHGQMWPLNVITNLVYEVSAGFVRKGDTQIYVSCGVGTWGPPVRTTSRPEVVDITVDFQ